MNFEFAEQINPHLEKLDFAGALAIAESRLKQIPPTEFHTVLGHSLVSQADDLASWIEEFYTKASRKSEVKALYFEMNEFDINTDYWYIDGFAYDHDGGLHLEDMEWLCDYKTDTQEATGTVFQIEGYEPLQQAFASIKLTTKNRRDARDWCEQIIIARFMELMSAAHLKARERQYQWAALPLYCTEHEYDFIVRSDSQVADRPARLS